MREKARITAPTSSPSSLRVQVARMRWSPSQRELALERVAHPAAVVDVAGAADEGDSSSASAVESTSGR